MKIFLITLMVILYLPVTQACPQLNLKNVVCIENSSNPNDEKSYYEYEYIKLVKSGEFNKLEHENQGNTTSIIFPNTKLESDGSKFITYCKNNKFYMTEKYKNLTSVQEGFIVDKGLTIKGEYLSRTTYCETNESGKKICTEDVEKFKTEITCTTKY